MGMKILQKLHKRECKLVKPEVQATLKDRNNLTFSLLANWIDLVTMQNTSFNHI